MQIRITKHVRAPVDAVHAWCTEYREDDPSLGTVHLMGRRVVRRDADLVELDDLLSIGRPTPVHYLVHLHPPDRWEADGRSRRGSVHNSYQLMRVAEGTRLDVSFDLHPRGVYRGLAALASPVIRRRLSRLWDDLVRSMASAA